MALLSGNGYALFSAVVKQVEQAGNAVERDYFTVIIAYWRRAGMVPVEALDHGGLSFAGEVIVYELRKRYVNHFCCC